MTVQAAVAAPAKLQGSLVPLPQLRDLDRYNPNTLVFTPKAELERR